MEKIEFTFNDTNETVAFYVLEQTKINGSTYILVTDSEDEEEDAECLIMKEVSVGDDGVFEELLENTDIRM